MIALGVWLEFLDQSFEAAIDAEQLLYGPYLIIAAGCGVVVVAAVGMVGACCDHKVNRVLLGVVSGGREGEWVGRLEGGWKDKGNRLRVEDVLMNWR